MKLRILSIWLTLLFCLCLSGCLGENRTPEPSPSAEASAEPRMEELASPEEIRAFEDAAALLAEKNAALDAAVDAAKALFLSEGQAYDESLRLELNDTLAAIRQARTNVPERPGDPEELSAAVEAMARVDYAELLTELAEKQAALEQSMALFALVDNPDEARVIACLGRVPGVLEVEAATPARDPNGKLNKPGGYTAAIFFSHENVDQAKISGSALMDKGTAAGGQIEVYATREDALKRDAYIQTFAESGVSTGGHAVVGTCVVRVSYALSEEQQEALIADVTAQLLTEN